MQKEELVKLEEELKSNLEEFSKFAESSLPQYEQIVEGQIKEVISIYSNDLRNIGIISGTIAPFSLTLLSIDRLDSNLTMLVCGFVVLLVNVALSQFFLKKQVDDTDKDSLKAQMHVIFAEDDIRFFKDSSKEVMERVNRSHEYIKNTREADKLLGIGKYNLRLQSIRSKLRKYAKITSTLFAIGTLYIVLSVILNPVVGWTASFVYWIRLAI